MVVVVIVCIGDVRGLEESLEGKKMERKRGEKELCRVGLTT